MEFQVIQHSDFDAIRLLQPPDWPDILPNIKLYIESPNCWPIKATHGNEVLGIGAAICHDNSAWLAHIIVNEKFRKQGIGSAIVAELMNFINSKRIFIKLLIATPLGLPIYEKAGFKKVLDYLFFKREKPCNTKSNVIEIHNYHENYKQRVLALDKQITGENRSWLLEPHLNSAFLIIEKNDLLAFYIPTLGEGPIISQTEVAGLELMKIKYANLDKAAIPENNKAEISFLLENGFTKVSKGTRMIFGRDLIWHPENIFSRIGGNFG